MKIEYIHASKFGHGVAVAEEFRKGMTARGVAVSVRHIREADPTRLPGPTCTCSAPRDASASRSVGCGASSRE
jgi:hypothetical protein